MTWTGAATLPLAVAVPLIAAALLAATQPLRRRRAAEGLALVAALATTVLCVLALLGAARHGELVYWFGGWRPHRGVALGIDFAVDPLGAGLAAFAGILTIAALVFSWQHFDSIGHAFPALLLVLQASMTGFCLTGDLFDMFVFFELMTVVAIALTAYRSDERAPLEGAFNLGVCNAIGGFLVLIGIALLYGRTGALNLAEIGVALSSRPGDDLVVIAFGLISAGFLVKAAIVPFHFWLADAYASAPTPVCIVFAGVMSEMGLYGLARVYETVFAASLAADTPSIRLVLAIAGALTAITGALMCLREHLIKRVLAFATISSMGLFLIGFAMLDQSGLAGAAVYVIADGLLKAGLFVCVGVLQRRRAYGRRLRLRGTGHGLAGTAAAFALGGLGLAAVPGSGGFAARTLIELGADEHPGYGWVAFVVAAAETLTAAAVLAAAARAFLGLGPDQTGDVGDDDPEDSDDPGASSSALLTAPAVVLVLGGIAAGVVPGVRAAALAAAGRFDHGAALDHGVLTGHLTAVPAITAPSPSLPAVLVGVGLTAAAVALATVVVAPRHSPLRPVVIATGLRRVGRISSALHSGHPGDYVTWLAAGTAALCGALVLAAR